MPLLDTQEEEFSMPTEYSSPHISLFGWVFFSVRESFAFKEFPFHCMQMFSAVISFFSCVEPFFHYLYPLIHPFNMGPSSKQVHVI